MNRKKILIILGILYLVHVVASAQGFSSETCLLIPQTKVSLNESNTGFRTLYEILCLATAIYKSDAIERKTKEELTKLYGGISSNTKIRFDFDNINMGKKGWVRYYPFYVNGRYLIVRIFLTEERSYQTVTPVLFEATLEKPAITFQILPNINDILKYRKAEPQTISVSSHAQLAASL